MGEAININDVLDGHVSLALDCLDRIYLNGYVPRLQTSGQVAWFMTEHLGLPVASPAVFDQIGNRFRREVRAFAKDHHVPMLRLASPDRARPDDRKLDHVQRYLTRAERRHRPAVVAIVAAQELAWVWNAKRNRQPRPGVARFSFVKGRRQVTAYYLSVGDPPVKGRWVWPPPGCLGALDRSRGQAGAPAAKRGRTSLTSARTGACLAARG